MSPTPTPTPIPNSQDAVIVGFLDPDLVPAAPGENPCPELCEQWDGGASSLANPPTAGWELTKVIAEIEANKGQPFSGATLDDILGTSNASAPSIVAGLVVGLVVITAAIAALVRHRGTSPSVTTAEEAN